MTDLVVRFAGVAKSYPGFQLGELDFELPAGGVLGFIGANGAGKSTTLRILMGLLRQDRGSVEVLGLPMPAREVAVKREVGFVSEDMRLYEAATLRWHMDFVAGIFPGWDAAYAAELLRRFELDPRRRIKGLSLGQRIKATLLLAFARRPRLLVFDEPTLGLDPLARQEVLGTLMEALADDRRTVLFSSQNTADVEQIADRLLFIDHGRIIEDGDKESFLDRWRRLRLELPPGAKIPPLPGIVESSGGGRLAALLTDRYEPGFAAACARAGASVLAVEPLTLEEIFLASVRRRRKGEVAA